MFLDNFYFFLHISENFKDLSEMINNTLSRTGLLIRYYKYRIILPKIGNNIKKGVTIASE
jgi:hypothetical protein